MALDPVVNFFRSEIATLPLASGGTSMVITTGDGNKLPNPSVDGAFNLTIYNASDPFVTPEIVRCTAKSGDTLTITRAQEGTSATNKTSGSTWYVELTPTAKTIQDIDSAKLDKAGGTMTGDLTIPDKIIHSGDTNTAIRFPSADTVTIETAGTERMRVDSSGNVGIGENNPTTPIEVKKNVSATGLGSNPLITVHNPISTSFNVRSEIVFKAVGVVTAGISSSYTSFASGGNYGSDLIFATKAAADASIVARMTIANSGNIGIGTTSPATKLDVSGSIRASTGILFGSDTAAANTLDDYEEGTWTPAWSFSTSGSATITISHAVYTKIGNLFYFSARFFTSSISSPTGTATITGLPFTCANADTAVTLSTMFRWGTSQPDIKASVASTSINLEKGATTTDFIYLQGSDFETGAGNKNVISVSGFYRVS